MRARYLFAGPIRNAVHATKYQAQRVRADWIGDELLQIFQSELGGVDFVTPVPLAPRRRKRRGYNQSELIARRLAEQCQVDVLPALARIRETPPQVGLSAAQRQLNVQEAFEATMDIAGTAVLLIDDVITTGSTLDACAVALERAGARRVFALTLASESRHDIMPKL